MKRELMSQLFLNIQNLLTSELKCYRRLVELSERQQRFIRLGDIDALTSILAQKEDLISKISQLDNAIQHIFRQSPELWQQMPESVNRLINAIATVLKRLTLLEKESESNLTDKYKEIKKELGNLKQTKTIVKTYTPQRTYRPRFIDKTT